MFKGAGKMLDLVRTFLESRIRNVLLRKLSLRKKSGYFAIVILLQLCVALVVWEAGGVRYAYAHLMYPTLILCSWVLGLRLAIISSVISGFVLGPYMPMDVTTMEMQAQKMWMLRICFFVLFSIVSSLVFNQIKNIYMKLSNVAFVNHETGFPNQLMALSDVEVLLVVIK